MNKIETFSIITFIIFVAVSFIGFGISPINNAEALSVPGPEVFELESSSFDPEFIELESSSFGLEVFGGKIGGVTQCTCTGDILFSTGLPRPATLMYVPGSSKLYEFKRIAGGVWTLGTHSGSKACIKRIKNKCIIVGAGSVVQLQGTSK